MLTPVGHQQPRPETVLANALWARRALDLYPVPRGYLQSSTVEQAVEGGPAEHGLGAPGDDAEPRRALSSLR